MTTDQGETLEAKASEPSLLKKFWRKGSLLLGALGLAYVLNAGYHFTKSAKLEEEREWRELLVEGQAVFISLQGEYLVEEQGYSWEQAEEHLKKQKRETLDPLIEDLQETLRERNYHRHKALNPFY